MQSELKIKNKYKTKVTKDLVFNSAIEIMEKKGWENTTIRDICKHAGISIGTFYNYFKTKNDIFYEIYKAADDHFINNVKGKLEGETAKEKIISYFRHYAKLNTATGIEETKLLYNPSNEWFLRRRPMQDVLSEIIVEGQKNGELITNKNSDEIVDYLFILIRGVCYNWCTSSGSYDLEEKMIDYLKMILVSITKNN